MFRRANSGRTGLHRQWVDGPIGHGQPVPVAARALQADTDLRQLGKHWGTAVPEIRAGAGLQFLETRP